MDALWPVVIVPLPASGIVAMPSVQDVNMNGHLAVLSDLQINLDAE